MESAPGGPPRPSHAARTPTVTDHIKYGFAWRDHRQWPASSAAALNHPGMQMCWSTWALRPRPRYLCCIRTTLPQTIYVTRHATVPGQNKRYKRFIPFRKSPSQYQPGRHSQSRNQHRRQLARRLPRGSAASSYSYLVQ